MRGELSRNLPQLANELERALAAEMMEHLVTRTGECMCGEQLWTGTDDGSPQRRELMTHHVAHYQYRRIGRML